MKNTLIQKIYLALLSATVLLTPIFHSGCGSTETDSIAAIVAKKNTFEIAIPAFGELKAVKSTPINVPNHLRGRQIISWLAPENSNVKKDEIVIRLDSSSYLERIKGEEFKIAKFNLDIQQKKRQLDKEKSELLSQLDITAIEKELTEVYAARDESLYSKHKIIEDQLDLDYLKQKTQHYNQKKSKLEKKAQAELQLLYAKKKTCQVKVDQYQKALDSLEIKAPHDGLFIYFTRWSEKTRVGETVYRGRKLAELPDTSEMEAILQVLESEAAGLKKDLPVSITMDSAPDYVFYGKVIHVASIAKSLERESPLKYFEVKVKLDATKKELMLIGLHKVFDCLG